MERPRNSTLSWAALIGGVALYDMTCKDGDTMTERLWDAQEAHPVKRALVLGAIGVTALHLAKLLPSAVDPFVHLGRLKKLGGKHD